jgi:hypothetical protein
VVRQPRMRRRAPSSPIQFAQLLEQAFGGFVPPAL